MPDLLYVLITVAFFAAAAGFVSVCDRIIGPDADHGDPQGRGDDDADSLSAPAALDAAVATATGSPAAAGSLR